MTTKKLALQSLVAGLAAFAIMLVMGKMFLNLRVNINDFPGDWPLLVTILVLGVLGEQILKIDPGRFGAFPHVTVMVICALALTFVPSPGHQGIGLWVERFGQVIIPYNLGSGISWIGRILVEGYIQRKITMPSRF